MSAVEPFSGEQSRVVINLGQQYDVWIDALRRLAALPYGMKWSRRGETDYLYEVKDRIGNAVSRGRRSPETETVFAAYTTDKAVLQDRIAAAAEKLAESAGLYRALRLPLIPAEAAKILRESDKRRLLGTHLVVVGTNAVGAYQMEAAGRINDLSDETDDFDMAWSGTAHDPDGRPVWSMLKSVDDTYTVNTERTFQARNAKAYEFELLVAPSQIEGMAAGDRPNPIPLPEQEWLLRGRQVSHVVIARDGSPARVVAPDPRWFGLQKLWMAHKPERDPLKRAKDARQGRAILDAVREAMPHYVLGDEFEASIPTELEPHWTEWKATWRELATPSYW